MTVTELTKDIYAKYTKVWDMFIMDYLPEFEYNTNLTFYPDNGLSVNNQGIKVVLPFSMLYGLLEDFFDKHDIFLHYELHPCGFIGGVYTNYRDVYNHMNYEKRKYYNVSEKSCFSMDEAKYQAILKACEILERRL